MKQISIQIDNKTAEQIMKLAVIWGLPPVRHNTPVISRCIERVWMQYQRENNQSGIQNHVERIQGA